MSFDELENIKLKAETEYLQALTKELNNTFKSPKKKWYDKIKNWTGVLLAVVSLGTAIWGFFMPIKNYFLEKESLLKYELNSQMVELVEDLDSNNAVVSDRSILLLGYYERNSLPILFYKLEILKSEDKVPLNNISKTIANIYESSKTNKKEIKTIIKKQLDNQIQKLKTNPQIDHFNIYAIHNLLYVIQQLPLNKKDAKEFIGFMSQIKNDIVIIDNTIINPSKEDFSSLFKEIDKSEKKLEHKKS